jgi:hypothetical protein
MRRSLCFCVAGVVYLAFCGTAQAVPDYWDPDLDLFCGLELEDVVDTVTPGHGYWRLVSATFEDESESGFNHHIYYKCLNVNGNGIEGQKTWGSWNYTDETGFASQDTKGAVDGYWGNFAMYANCPGPPEAPCGWPYNAWIDTASSAPGYNYIGPSDKVWGMGMHNPFGTPCGAHVNFRLIWQWTIKEGEPQPSIALNKTSITTSAKQTASIPNKTFEVWNDGAQTLNYSISDDRSWMSCTPPSGNSTGEHDTITVHFDSTGLLPGNYGGTITVTDAQADDSPQTISVTLTIDPVSADGDFDGDVDVSDFALFNLCFGGTNQPIPEGCMSDSDYDNDQDVDVADFAAFQLCFNGAGQPPACSN